MLKIKYLLLTVAISGLMVGSANAKMQFLPDRTDSDLGFSGNKINSGHGVNTIDQGCASGSTQACRQKEILVRSYVAPNKSTCYVCRAGTAQDCINDGYKLKESYPKSTFLNKNRLDGSFFANIFNNIIGIKSAHAEATESEYQKPEECFDCHGQYRPDEPILPNKPIVDNDGLKVPDSEIKVPVDNEKIWKFETQATCPYNSNYVKGKWTADMPIGTLSGEAFLR